ncbi:MAG: transposase [Acidobacteria bacterium]|nr:transposase [Acidobacteriota bacterium]
MDLPACCVRCHGSELHRVLYHIIFSTRSRRPWINADIRVRLYPYLGGTVRGLGGISLEIGGVADHIHLLASLPPIFRRN